MDCVPDHEFAMREVAQEYELIKSQQPLLQFCNEQPSSATTTNLVLSRLNEALQALCLALSVMDPQQLPAAVAGHSSSTISNRSHLLGQKRSGAGDSKGVLSKRTRYVVLWSWYHLVVSN